MDFEIKNYNSLDESLKVTWKSFEKESVNYCFQSYEWFENWVNNYRVNNNNFLLCICVVKYKSKVICIFPFEIEKKFNLKILKWAGDKHTDYCSPLIRKDFFFDKKTFINLYEKVLSIIKNIDVVYLTKQPECINEIKNPFIEFLKNFEDSQTYSISLPNKWEYYTNQILKREFYRQNLRKKKLLKRLGSLKFKIYENRDEKTSVLNELFKQKNIRLRSKKIEDILKSNDLEFYKEFEKEGVKDIKTHLSSLVLNNELIAIHWGVIYKKRFYYLLLSMQEGQLNKYSPGRLLISLLIRWSISKKLEVFDFTLGGESYKKSWSNKNSYLFNYVESKSLKGFNFFLLIKIKLFLKKIYKKITTKK
tara:strand:+ start:3001 stop:4089 length:1089 start_codon:yes stop_codon:yes gene_type:complete